MPSSKGARKPIVFISSTDEDLKEFRRRVREAALALGFHPRMMEYFPVGGNPPLDECLALISGSDHEQPSDLLIVLVAHRYGWVPEGQPSGERKSITWLECLQAESSGQEILAFLVDESAPWDEILKEEHRLTLAMHEGKATPELFQEVQRSLGSLKELKKWLSDGRMRDKFTTPNDLQAKVTAALHHWLKRHPEVVVDTVGDPSQYLRGLRKETAYIDIRGLQVSSGRATRFPIEDLYIPLKTVQVRDPDSSRRLRAELAERPKQQELEKALSSPRLVVTGDPGGGKTTFLRRICQLVCRAILDDNSEAIQAFGFQDAPFPIFLRLSELQDHRTAFRGRPGAPAVWSAPEWLVHCLANQWANERGGLDAGFFRRKLQDGPALLLLDGLDEAASEQDRKSLVQWIEKLSARWENCRVVVTSRPAAYRGESVLPEFDHASIEALEDSAIEAFFARWCNALFPSEPDRAEKHQAELFSTVHSRPEIHELARNPVMLTALAVVHWNENRLPEQRAELYDSILTWLSRSRDAKEGRVKPERCILLLQNLALSMHCHPKGRLTQISRHQAARSIAADWRELPEPERLPAAEEFLRREEEDSGIVVGRGHELRFWHLTFQEHLAARALAARSEYWHRILFEDASLYKPEWKEVVLLLGGVLQTQGVERVDNLFSAVLDDVEERKSLEEKARAAGLLGNILQNLSIVQYKAPDPPRFRRLLHDCKAVFDCERSKEVSIEVTIEAAEAIGQAGDPRLSPQRSHKNWVEIPAGEFWMGAQKADSAKPNFDPEAGLLAPEGPVHKVWLDAYRIGRYPVTVAEYQRFLGSGGYADRRNWGNGGFGEWSEPASWAAQLKHPSRPVVGVSWLEASAYACWVGAQLPTEAQWEKAARGDGAKNKYPWGDREPSTDHLNYQADVGHPTPVGVYPQGATPAGISDLAGNVWEWCRDWYAKYPNKLQKDPIGPKKGKYRVLRGGAWNYDAWYCRSSYRDWDGPAARNDGVGFRVVLVSSSARTKKRKP